MGRIGYKHMQKCFRNSRGPASEVIFNWEDMSHLIK
jgi:hypothetical protein